MQFCDISLKLPYRILIACLLATKMTKDTTAWKPDSVVLVTGANGYIASHVVNELLKIGYRVKGTVREPKPWLNKMFDNRYGPDRFILTVLHDFNNVGKIRETMEGADAIIHLVCID